MGLGDGYRNAELNVPSCGYDGGDCCVCGCLGDAYPLGSFDSLDPDAEDQLSTAAAGSPALFRGRSAYLGGGNLGSGTGLGSYRSCSGGSFEVEWHGSIVMTDLIYVGDGTVLAVFGDGTSAVVDGNSTTRLLAVVNATLHVSGVDISFGASIVGGAIAAAGSTVTLNRTNLVGNCATAGRGGVLYVSDGSSLTCVGGGTFADNRAGIDGGALYTTGSSTVSCGGSWMNNIVGDSGGAVGVCHLSNIS